MKSVSEPLTLLTLATVVVGALFVATSLRAEEVQSDKEQPRQLRVLDSQEVNMGSRSIIYNRVETPVLKPQPAAIEQPTVSVAEHVPTAEELAEMRRWEAMNHVSLLLSCTVYDNQLTEVRFRHGDSEVVFWSTINFNSLSQLMDLQIKDTYYNIFMAVGDSTKGEFDQQNAELLRTGRSDLVSIWPNGLLKSVHASGKSAWHITSKGSIPPEALLAIEDLHSHFDANRDALIAQHAEREAARIAHERWIQENPPQPKDTVIQFFPIRSSHSPTEAKTFESGTKSSSLR